MKIDPQRMAQASRDLASLSIKQIICRHWWKFRRPKWVRGKHLAEYICRECGAFKDEISQ